VTSEPNFLPSAKFMVYACMTVISFLREKEYILAMKVLMSVAKTETFDEASHSPKQATLWEYLTTKNI